MPVKKMRASVSISTRECTSVTGAKFKCRSATGAYRAVQDRVSASVKKQHIEKKLNMLKRDYSIRSSRKHNARDRARFAATMMG